ncbi:hypothetical protein ASD56_07705 [Microbacterium sp. Root166]|uniref:SUMF1/EgtB/PvdO family nonheme iron enzyme n=1 Tax=Microbacterium sp. Root166 TaxID=1736478 RepID=UPI0006FB4473|nr:SUMF1/EgtB/PvdO family nonheme iron enzyme [Microbacterium sp. Root166]KQZ86135.1 hypothetical protein ASD56_07705 [Microbacterium sp. Root166]
MSGGFDPLVPRELDRPTVVPLDEDVTGGETAARLDDAKIFAAPADPADLDRWRAQLAAWRAGAIERHGAPTRYDQPEAAWSADCFTVAQVWLWDELFFDFTEQRFTPERFLADAQQRFGGLDGVVLWHAYPVIGIDDRNQWDFYDVPGLPDAAAALHESGVRVFVDYNPWDTGTRRSGEDVDELAEVIRRLGADGVFLDTLKNADPGFVAALDRARPGIGLEGESKLATDRIADHSLSWAQWFADTTPPGVLRAHLFERRHMQHHIRRWHRDHSDELVSSWLNGVGVMVWEVVFGAWVGWNERDAATLRRMLPVQRRLHRWLVEGEWTPLAVCDPSGLSGSSFVLDGVTLTTLANTSDADLEFRPSGSGRWIALHDGSSSAVVVPARGVAAVLEIAEGAAEPEGLEVLRAELAAVSHDRDASFPHLRARRLAPPVWSGPTADDAVRDHLSAGAVRLEPGKRVVTVRYRQRETGMYDGAPYVDEWKPLPPRLHDQRTLERVVELSGALLVGAAEVSAAEYAEFLSAIGEEADAASPDAPATGVTFARAREYAAWAGGRLPTEDEWQVAAADPAFIRRSPVVWNWTESEHSDGRSRFVMLKGGSDHVSEGSDWYFDGGVRHPEFSAKFLLPGLGVDASPSIGFRVCWEASA